MLLDTFTIQPAMCTGGGELLLYEPSSLFRALESGVAREWREKGRAAEAERRTKRTSRMVAARRLVNHVFGTKARSWMRVAPVVV